MLVIIRSFISCVLASLAEACWMTTGKLLNDYLSLLNDFWKIAIISARPFTYKYCMRKCLVTLPNELNTLNGFICMTLLTLFFVSKVILGWIEGLKSSLCKMEQGCCNASVRKFPTPIHGRWPPAHLSAKFRGSESFEMAAFFMCDVLVWCFLLFTYARLQPVPSTKHFWSSQRSYLVSSFFEGALKAYVTLGNEFFERA